MPELKTCRACGVDIQSNAPFGHCPQCLLAMGFGPIPKEALEPTADSPAQSSIGNPQSAIATVRNFGDYEIVEEIARGGMGVVYKARQKSLDRFVAIKTLLFGSHADPAIVRRFKIEAVSAGALHHPNIVAIHEVGLHEGQHFIVMDFVDGPSLTSFAREPLLPAKRAAGYVKTIAEAIHYAHERGILHRDLKPSNVLIDANGQPHVTDFGLARRLDGESSLTQTGQILGSPNYMSPEQAAARHDKNSRRSDVYGLGAILYHLLTGRPPFRGETLADTLQQVVNNEPIAPRLLNASTPADLQTICLKCLEKEPARRFQTAQQLAEDLGRSLNSEPIQARPTTRPERVWRWCRRKPALAAAAGVTIIAAAVALVLALLLHHLEHRRVSERRAASIDNALIATRSGDLDEAEKAIAAAELSGVPAGELRLLRGQLAYHRRDFREAIRHLEQAALLSPNSVAIPAILSLAYDQVGEWSKGARMLDLVASLNPKTPEDYLFKGIVEGEWDSVRGLATLDKAVQLRPSAIALLVRAEARVNLADDFRDVAEAGRAITEMDVIQDMLPGSPLVLSASLMAQLAAANAYGDNGQARHRELALAKAASANEALKQYPRFHDAVSARTMYLKYVGDSAGLLDAYAQADPQMSFLSYSYAAELYACGAFSEAIRVTERGAWTNAATSDYCRAYILAELPNGPERALQEFHRFWEAHPPGVDALNVQTILRLLGRKAEAVAACRSLRPQFNLSPGWRNGWYQTVLDYNLEAIGSIELLKAAGKSRWNQCEAHFHIALNRLADGDRNGSREHFRRVVALNIVYFYEDKWSRAFLRRIEKDPNWPPWIPAKSRP